MKNAIYFHKERYRQWNDGEKEVIMAGTEVKYYGYNAYNSVALMGRLTRDPDVRYTQGENPFPYAHFTVAVDKHSQDENKTADFINCVAKGDVASRVEKLLRKGTKIVLTGRLETDSYTNREGQKVYTTEVKVENFFFAEGKSNADSATPQQTPVQGNTDGFMNIPDGIEEQLPFN